MKVDWEAAFSELWYLTKHPMSRTRDKFLAYHTTRTEEDLPEKGVFLVRFPGCHWFTARFKNREICGYWEPYGEDTGILSDRGINTVLMQLEIGPEIKPPEETKESVSPSEHPSRVQFDDGDVRIYYGDLPDDGYKCEWFSVDHMVARDIADELNDLLAPSVEESAESIRPQIVIHYGDDSVKHKEGCMVVSYQRAEKIYQDLGEVLGRGKK